MANSPGKTDAILNVSLLIVILVIGIPFCIFALKTLKNDWDKPYIIKRHRVLIFTILTLCSFFVCIIEAYMSIIRLYFWNKNIYGNAKKLYFICIILSILLFIIFIILYMSTYYANDFYINYKPDLYFQISLMPFAIVFILVFMCKIPKSLAHDAFGIKKELIFTCIGVSILFVFVLVLTVLLHINEIFQTTILSYFETLGFILIIYFSIIWAKNYTTNPIKVLKKNSISHTAGDAGTTTEDELREMRLNALKAFKDNQFTLQNTLNNIDGYECFIKFSGSEFSMQHLIFLTEVRFYIIYIT